MPTVLAALTSQYFSTSSAGFLYRPSKNEIWVLVNPKCSAKVFQFSFTENKRGNRAMRRMEILITDTITAALARWKPAKFEPKEFSQFESTSLVIYRQNAPQANWRLPKRGWEQGWVFVVKHLRRIVWMGRDAVLDIILCEYNSFLWVYTPYSKMAASKLFFCLHVYWPSLPHFHFKILLSFLHADEASRAN